MRNSKKTGYRLTTLLFTSLLPLSLPQFAMAETVPNGTISPIVDVNSGLCLGVKGSSNSSGAQLQIQNCNGSDYQRWQVSLDSSNWATIKNVGSNQCIDVTDGSAEPGTNLQQWGCSGADYQAWNISAQGNGQYAIISKYNDLAVDVYGARTDNGSRVVQYTWTGADNQRWTFPGSGSSSSGSTNTTNTPFGFATGTTGGAGGQVVTVSTPSQLENAIKGNDAKIIRVNGIIDFRGTRTTSAGCTYSDNYCSYNGKQEKILDRLGYCDGRSTYNITYDAAGPSGMRVGSNKTIIGVGSRSGIKGKGFYLRDGVSNIIIRNLSITDINDGLIWGGDAITVDNASRIWIDHNYIARIGRQMLVTGWGTAKQMTVSNNYFDGTTDYGHYCNAKHYWTMLLIGENQSITLANNRIRNTSGRAPKIDSGIVHMVNNYFDGNYAGGLSGGDTNIIMEGNYYTRSSGFSPIDQVKSGTLFAPLSSTLGQANSSCSNVLGRSCVENYDENGQKKFAISGNVMSAVNSNGSWRSGVRATRPVSTSAVRSFNFGPQGNIN
ncbi:RICIN domain-containing protein [Vibrio mangrovi]|uniref:pectin lyase n=1 Tax=Vibrio mangrovi TaxID=474394 RepID=A0A1Y6J3D5_9VIBR|nr:RICIN domain-containing protein [Vibrio mangrovi]MDW6002654.1 RICIN domain-containing protein [Vibrio mangrovi]SMS02813.1 Extracellular exo-alpha-L-arabinofuranosidase precursor [Vibrio mangrovi]